MKDCTFYLKILNIIFLEARVSLTVNDTLLKQNIITKYFLVDKQESLANTSGTRKLSYEIRLC